MYRYGPRILVCTASLSACCTRSLVFRGQVTCSRNCVRANTFQFCSIPYSSHFWISCIHFSYFPLSLTLLYWLCIHFLVQGHSVCYPLTCWQCFELQGIWFWWQVTASWFLFSKVVGGLMSTFIGTVPALTGVRHDNSKSILLFHRHGEPTVHSS